MRIYLVMSDKFCIFVSVKQQVNDIVDVLRGLSAQIESMQKTIDSQHATICQINRTSQGQLKEIRDLKRMLKRRTKNLRNSANAFQNMRSHLGTPATAVGQTDQILTMESQ